LPASPLDLEKEHEKENTKNYNIGRENKNSLFEGEISPKFPKGIFCNFCDQN